MKWGSSYVYACVRACAYEDQNLPRHSAPVARLGPLVAGGSLLILRKLLNSDQSKRKNGRALKHTLI